MNNNTKNILSVVVVFAVAIWIFVATIGVQSFAAAQIRPQQVPRVVATAMIGLGIILLIQTIRAWEKKESLKIQIAIFSHTDSWQAVIEKNTALITFLLIFLYVFLMKKTGFVMITVFYLSFQITLLSGVFTLKQYFKNLLTSVIISVIIFFIFYRGFALALPVNSFGF